MFSKPIPISRLKELYRYDPGSGAFEVLKTFRGSKHPVGAMILGTRTKKGYLKITIDYHEYSSHRLAWFYMRGVWPKKHIDHIDGDRSNNRFPNLREATSSENAQNRRRAMSTNTTTGLLGVSLDARTNKYRASITANGKYRHIGLFTTPEIAHAAYLKAKRELHSFCTI